MNGWKHIRLVSQVASRPLVFGQPNAWLLILLLISLALVYDLRKNIKRLVVLSLLITGLFFLTKHPLENEITMLDVGQGESIFLRDVTGKTILLDVGGKAESDKKIENGKKRRRPAMPSEPDSLSQKSRSSQD